MDRPCLDRSSFNVWGLGITHLAPLLIIIILFVIILVLRYATNIIIMIHSILGDRGSHRTTL